MKYSQLFTKTTKDVPADERAKNAKLLIQAGYIHKEMAGVYTFLPLGLRVLNNINKIIREEMNAIGGQELLLTALQDAELWKVTDRWDDAKVDVWFKTKLKNGTELGLAPTQEEPLVRAAKRFVQSYKDLPFLAYQIQTKFRNETRSKSGIMRGREFLMKDMYSFARSNEEHEELYEKIKQAYVNIFNRVGIGEKTVLAFASGGMFSKYSHEFQTLVDAGEDDIYYDEVDNKYLNREIVSSKAPAVKNNDQPKAMEEVEGKGLIGVEQLAKFLKIPVEKTTKTMLYVTDGGKLVAAAVRGGYNISEDKLKDVLGVNNIELADEATVKRVTGADVGYAGLLNLSDEVQVLVDESCANRTNFEMGANRTNYHSINVNWGRDLHEPKEFVDIKVPQKGDLNPKNDKPYPVFNGAEVGNIFTLKDRFSKPLGLNFTDESGHEKLVMMGCYGLGPTRLMGVIVELMADDMGLVWPENLAPFQVYLVSLGSEEKATEVADELYKTLQEEGIEVLYDDRDARPGEKFADADLIGIPHRVVVSAKTVEAGKYEYKKRTEKDTEMLSIEQLLKKLAIQT